MRFSARDPRKTAGTFGINLMVKGLMATTTSHDTVREERGWRAKGIGTSTYVNLFYDFKYCQGHQKDGWLVWTTTSHDTLPADSTYPSSSVACSLRVATGLFDLKITRMFERKSCIAGCILGQGMA